MYYTFSRTQLYFTQQYSRDTTTCFGHTCGPSSGCDRTFQGPLYKTCGVFFGYWGLGGRVGGEGGEISFVSIVGTVGIGSIGIIISFLCTRVEVGFYSYAKDMLLVILVTI